MLTDAYTIIHQGLANFRHRLEMEPETLTLNDWKRFEIMSRQMVSLAVEERAQTSSDALDKLTDEELLQLSKAAEARLTSG